jgi:hypothetical protein
VPNLQTGQHYLEFTNPDECVEQVSRLMQDETLRRQLMTQAYAYYLENMPADVSLRRLLEIVQTPGR